MVIHTVLTDRKINGTIAELKSAVNTEQNIVNAFIKYSEMTAAPDLQLKSKKITDDHNKSTMIIEKHMALLTGLLKSNFIVLSLMAGFIIIMGLILFYYMIRLTHTISGPLFVISQHIQEIMDGKEISVRSLREDDQLKEFYSRFIEMAKKMQKDG
jgi:hypothetical protein